MTLGKQISRLRAAKGLSQEDLANDLQVSRQSISKWEADIALPETEKLLLLSEIFGVSLDTLLRDERTLDAVRENPQCGPNAVQMQKKAMYEGILIKESLEDDTVIDLMRVHKVELWKAGGRPKYWTVLFFSCEEPELPEKLSAALCKGDDPKDNWFADFKAGDRKYIVFHGKVLTYAIGNEAEKARVCAACREMGVPDEQMHWEE